MKTMKEQISLLVDNEASNSEAALSTLKSHSEHTQFWQRYHLIGDIMRGNTPNHDMQDLSDRVMHRLANVPTVFAPNSLSSRAAAFVKPAVGFAIAATVAAVTVVSLQLYRQTDVNKANADTAYEVVAIANPQPFIATPVSFGDKKLDQSGNTNWDVSRTEAQAQLNDYLMVHAEYASTGNIQGMLPYVRLAGFDKSQ